MDSNNAIWNIIFDCLRMESLQHRSFSTLPSEEKDFILIRLKRAEQAVQDHLDGSPLKKGRRAQSKPPRNW